MLQFWPDTSMQVERLRIGRVPTLILRPAARPPIPVAVLWFHGGGYALGMKEMIYSSRAADLLRMRGVTVVSPGYRLSWQKPFPAAAADCFDVLCYLYEHKDELGVDKIMVGGESAGGGLCAAVCMMARDAGIPIAFQMPLYPMLSNFDTESSRDNHGKIWNTRRNHLGWKLYLRQHADEQVSPYAAPALQTDYHNLPPCYTFVGDGEPFLLETLEYVQNLRNAGIEARVDVYHTNVHAFDLLLPNDEVARRARHKFLHEFSAALELYT
ncbi:MAG: alpha/beta hydrolase [Coriobacteriales bacterium]|nr:alpha/beta hydrolase [Coriobacteriales bacterium]